MIPEAPALLLALLPALWLVAALTHMARKAS
jgi:hypothetical protein